MSTERWRCFVAVPLGEELRRELAAAVDGWRKRADLTGLRWSDAGSWHVTLAFLGSIDASGVPGLVGRLSEAAAAHAPMHLRTGGVGGFPSVARAGVAWYGVDDPDGALASLARDVGRAAEADAGASFRGHVTLARARREPVDLRAWVRDAAPPHGELDVPRVELMRSHLSRGSARYEVIESIVMGVGAHV